MIIDFSVRNFAAINEEQTLSFEVGASLSKGLPYAVVEAVPGVRLLKLALIYGANASGKSTVLAALGLLKSLMGTVRDAKNTQICYEPFKLAGERRSADSSFELRFVVDRQCYRYALRFDRHCVLEEQLCRFDPATDEEAEVFHRTTDTENQLAEVAVSPEFCDDENIGRKFRDSMRWNETVFAGFQHVNAAIPLLKRMNEWIDAYFFPLSGSGSDSELYAYVSRRIERGEISKENVVQLLRRADFMISDIRFPQLASGSRVKFHHVSESGEAELDYEEESLGTRRFYAFAGLLDRMANLPGFFPIDEIDASMHPDLLEFFLHAFLFNTEGAQILATVHHRELLRNRELLHPDMLWFTEKRPDGSTDLYAIEDFDPSVFRTDKPDVYYNAYKTGRLGAKPYMGDYSINLKHHE